jgi:hypothetical protein
LKKFRACARARVRARIWRSKQPGTGTDPITHKYFDNYGSIERIFLNAGNSLGKRFFQRRGAGIAEELRRELQLGESFAHELLFGWCSSVERLLFEESSEWLAFYKKLSAH